MTESIYLIYKHTSPSGKSYIGQTKDYDTRCKQHQAEDSPCRAFSAAIKKYGWDNFTHEMLIEYITLDEANSLEVQFILEHQSLFPGGYNLTEGGGGCRAAEETRKKRSTSLTLWYKLHPEAIIEKAKARLGYKHSIETIKKLTGQVRSPEQRRALSTALKGIPKSQSHKDSISTSKTGKAGRKHTEESRQKISISKKGVAGHKQTEQTKIDISTKLTGIKRSEETKLKLSIIKKGLRKGHKWFYNPNTGATRTYATNEVPLGWVPGRGVKKS